jgi:putative exosortase-associated protein (TIGR04073 family)
MGPRQTGAEAAQAVGSGTLLPAAGWRELAPLKRAFTLGRGALASLRNLRFMRFFAVILTASLGLWITGCAGPEQKLGRGLSNVTEFARFGEISRSIEQTALWDGPQSAFTTGFIRGFNRSVARTAVGAFEVATFPAPPYKPLMTPKHRLYPDSSIRTTTEPYGGLKLEARKVYPASYQPNLISDALFSTDGSLGFSGGDIAPMIPGSRFRIFDN